MHPKRCSDGGSEDGIESLPSTSRSDNGSRSEEEEDDDGESESDETDDDDDEEEDEDEENEEGESGSEDDDETNGTTSEGSETEEEEDDPIVKTDRNPVAKVEEHDSDSSDGQSDKCPICLSRFGAQEMGTPDSCDHAFCLDCILEWSKNMNTCPVDRRTFGSVTVRRTPKGKVLRKVQVKGKTGREEELEEEEEEDPTYCEVCNLSDREDRLLLCDGCDMGFHLECLNPPLRTVPVEEWFCPQCAAENGQGMAEAVGIEEGEVMALLEDENVNPRNVGLRSRGGYRLLPRTRQSETVRLRIQRTRATQRRLLNTEDDITPNAVVRNRRAPIRRKRTVRRRRKTTRRKKKTTTSKTKSSSNKKPTKRKTSGKKKSGTTKRRKKTRRRRRKTGKRRVFRKVTPVSSSTPKTRLAEQLGLKLLPNRMVPVIDTPSAVKAASGRQYDVAASSLSLFGTRDDLIAFDDGNDEGDVAIACSGPSAVSRRRHVKGLSTSALLSHRPLSIGGMRSRQSVPSIFLPPPPQESFDLLGSILTSQSLLIGKGNNYTIQRDGSLLPRRTVGLPPHSTTTQCPSDPVHGPHDNGNGGGAGATKDGRSNGGNTSSHGPSSSGHNSESWTRCSTANQPSSDRSHADRCRSSSGSTGEGSSHVGADCNRRTHVSPQKKRLEKEQKKPLDDDDIDIYSDIESGSFENEAEDVAMDRLSVAEDEESPDPDPSGFGRLATHPDDANDGEEAEVRDSDECSDDDLVIDESIKHEEEDVANAVNVVDDSEDRSRDVSDGEDLVIDDTEGGSAHNACEESSDVDCENPNRCNSDMSDTNRNNLDVEDDAASNDNVGETDEQAAEVASSDEDEEGEEAGRQDRSDLVEDSFAPDKSCSNLQDSIESPLTEEHEGEAQGDTSGGEGDGEEDEGNEQNHEDHKEFVPSSDEVEDEGDDEVEGGVEHECDDGEEEEVEERGQVEEEEGGGNEAEYEEENEDEAREEENEDEARVDENEEETREEENEYEENVGEIGTAERHEQDDDGGGDDEEYEPTSANEEEPMNYEGHKEDEEHYNAEGDATELAQTVNSGAEEVGTDDEEDNNAKTELSHETSFSSELYEADAVRLPEERDESNEEAEIDVSKLAHRQKRRAMVSVRETPSSSRHGTSSSSYRHKRRKGSLRDYEDGEITEIGAPQRKLRQSRKSRQSRAESPDEYDIHPRVNISELPRIPKLKRDRSSKDRTESNGPSGNPSCSSSASANNASDSKRTGVMARLDKGGAAEISWKKLSHNNKTRNYRDGKPKCEQKHYRAKESKDNSGEKWTGGVQSTQLSGSGGGGVAESKRRASESDKEKRKDKDRDVEYYEKTERHSETIDWQRTKEKEKTHRTVVKHDKDKYKDKYRDKHYKSEKHRDSKEKHKHGKSKEVPIERSKEKSSYEKIVVVSEKPEKREKKVQKREKIRQLDRLHREEKHREHKQKREKERAITTTVVTIRSREASPIESKEVYASGDSIIVNVNFSRPTSKENPLKDVTDEKLIKEKELLKMGEDCLDVKRRIGDVDVRDRLGEKRSPPDEATSESNKRMKYDDSKGLSIVVSPSDRWNPFDSDVEEPPIPIDSDFHSDGSFSPYRSPLHSGLGNDTDTDSDVVEIIQTSNVAGSIDPIVKDNKRDDKAQSPATISEDFEDFTNCDSNLGETVPRSPPSPADDNSVYDPFDPTKSLSTSPCSSPGRDSLSGSNNKAENPEPPPLPELPPLPPEPDPDEPLPPRPDSPSSSSSSSPSSPAEPQSAPFISSSSSAPTTSIPSLLTMTAPTTSVHPRPCIQMPPTVPVSVAGPSGVSSAPPQQQQQPPPSLIPHGLPPPFSLANIHVPPPNYIPRTMPPPTSGGPVQLPNMRPMGWPLFPPGGNFLGPPPLMAGTNVPHSSQSVALTQIGTLLHNQAAQLAMLAGGRPGGPRMSIPPPISISALLQAHGHGPPPQQQQQQQQHFPQTSSTQNGETKRSGAPAQDVNEVVDMDVDSPYSPGDTLDTEETHASDSKSNSVGAAGAASSTNPSESSNRFKDRFDCLLGFVQSRKENVQAKHGGHGRGRGHHPSRTSRDRPRDDGRRRQEAQKKHIVRFEVSDRSHKGFRGGGGGAKDKKVEDGKKEVTVKMDETQLKILDELPSSAVEMQVKEKFLKKLNRQERVIEEVKLAIKPYYNRREITKDDYKEILRKSVPKICHNKSGEINPVKIKALVEGYVKKFKYHRKGGESSKGGSAKKS